MFWSKKKEWFDERRYDLVQKIERDVEAFVVRELITYKQNTTNKTLGDSVIANIALFDLAALNTKDGYDQMINLLSDHQNQLVNRRMRQLLHTLYIRYGIDPVDDVANDSLLAMVGTYKLNNDTIADLDDKYNILWLVSFIREAYFNVMQYHENTTEEKQ